MKWSTWRSRHRILFGTATSAAAVTLIAVGVPAAALATHPASHAGPAQIGPGYPPPGGIYAPFTNCPLLNPLMAESTPGNATGCVAGQVTSGSITIGSITTPVVRPVNVQYGIWDPVNASAGGDNPAGGQWAGGILPPPAGLSAMLVTKPDLIPVPLTTVLGCATATDPVVKNLCSQAVHFGGKYLDVYAQAQTAGQITNFDLTTWTQRIKFKLINPLLGNCYIGSDNNPIVINPVVTGTLSGETDPNPARFPNIVIFVVSGGTATDTTFTAPGVTGCGPGGAKNIPVDEALDAGAGLPAASGVNSLTLSGTLYLADSYGNAIQAKTLLAAFKASVGTAGPRESVRRISAASLNKLRGRFGIK